MDKRNLELRNRIYSRFVEHGRAPSRAEIEGVPGSSPGVGFPCTGGNA
jgi:hypothetical protein